MKKITLATLIISSFAAFANAAPQYEGKYYLHLDAGVNRENLKVNHTFATTTASTKYGVTSKNQGYFAMAGVGYHLLDELRVDLSFLSSINNKSKENGNFSLDGNDVKVISRSNMDSMGLFLNGTYDIFTGTPFNPFITGGVGYTRSKFGGNLEVLSSYTGNVRIITKGENKSSVGYKAGAGIAYKIGQSMDIDFAFNYIQYGISKKKRKFRPIELVNPVSNVNKITFEGERKPQMTFTIGLRSSF